MSVLDERNLTPEFHVTVDTSGDFPCVSVSGELDLVTVAAFRDALSEAAESADGTIVLDARRLTFLGSTGIRELVRILQHLESIEVRHAAPIVRRALDTAGLEHSRLRVTGDAPAESS